MKPFLPVLALGAMVMAAGLPAAAQTGKAPAGMQDARRAIGACSSRVMHRLRDMPEGMYHLSFEASDHGRIRLQTLMAASNGFDMEVDTEPLRDAIFLCLLYTCSGHPAFADREPARRYVVPVDLRNRKGRSGAAAGQEGADGAAIWPGLIYREAGRRTVLFALQTIMFISLPGIGSDPFLAGWANSATTPPEGR